LQLYRERPGEQKISDRRAAARRGVRDTAICSKPSTRLWGLNVFSPRWFVAKGHMGLICDVWAEDVFRE
jgi:hypothetical protein